MIWARRAHCSCDPPHSSSRQSVIHKYVSQAGRRAGHEPTMSHSVRRSIGSALLPQPSPQHRMGIGPKCVHVNCAVPEGTRVHFLSYPALCLPHPNSRKSGANRGPRLLRPGLTPSPPLRGSSIRNSRAEPTGPVRLCAARSESGLTTPGQRRSITSRSNQASPVPARCLSRRRLSSPNTSGPRLPSSCPRPGAPHIRGFRMCGIKSRSSYLDSHSFQKQE